MCLPEPPAPPRPARRVPVSNNSGSNGGSPTLEFVVTDGAATWDKPLEGGNYLIPSAGTWVLEGGAISPVAGRPVMLVSDLDGTMVGDDSATAAFRSYWLETALVSLAAHILPHTLAIRCSVFETTAFAGDLLLLLFLQLPCVTAASTGHPAVRSATSRHRSAHSCVVLPSTDPRRRTGVQHGPLPGLLHRAPEREGPLPRPAGRADQRCRHTRVRVAGGQGVGVGLGMAEAIGSRLERRRRPGRCVQGTSNGEQWLPPGAGSSERDVTAWLCVLYQSVGGSARTFRSVCVM